MAEPQSEVPPVDLTPRKPRRKPGPSTPDFLEGDALLTPKLAAMLLRMSARTLVRWRTEPGYPHLPYIQFSPRLIRYRIKDVRAFMNGNRSERRT